MRRARRVLWLVFTLTLVPGCAWLKGLNRSEPRHDRPRTQAPAPQAGGSPGTASAQAGGTSDPVTRRVEQYVRGFEGRTEPGRPTADRSDPEPESGGADGAPSDPRRLAGSQDRAIGVTASADPVYQRRVRGSVEPSARRRGANGLIPASVASPPPTADEPADGGASNRSVAEGQSAKPGPSNVERSGRPRRSSSDEPAANDRSNPLPHRDDDSRVHAPSPLKPPRVVAVSAGPAPARRDDLTAPPTGVAVNRPARLTRNDAGVQGRIQELERAVAANPNDLDTQMRLRMLYLAEGLDSRALQTTPGMTRDVEELLLGLMRTLRAARSGPGRDSAQWANRQLAALDAYRRLLKQRADLAVPRVALCREVLSYGVYTEFSPAEFRAGQATPTIVYVEVENFQSDRVASGGFRTRLSLRLSILDRGGQEVWTRTDDQIEDVSRNRRNDFFVPVEVHIPSSLNPGRYTLKVAVTDLVAHKANENQTAFRLVAP